MKNFLYLFLVLLPSLRAQNDTLQLVHVLFRHGSRTPEVNDMYPTDPYLSSTFPPIGHGGLTNEGKMSSFKLGQVLRERYNKFLGDLYTSGIVDPTSTSPDRTKMSLLLVLAGLFPPAPSQKWHKSFNWLPIPYNYEEASRDFFLRHPLIFCPAYVNELLGVLKTEEYQNYAQNHSDFFQYVEKHSKRRVKTVFDIFLMYHTLYAEDTMNLTLPDWARAVYPAKFHPIAAHAAFLESYTPLLKRLLGGRLLGRIVNQMLSKANSTLKPQNRKLFLYSGHDYNVFGMLGVLHLLKPHMPKYSSSILFELHLVEGSYGVKIFYLRHPDAKPELQKLEDCDELCPLSKFVELTKDRIPVNYAAECKSKVNFN